MPELTQDTLRDAALFAGLAVLLAVCASFASRDLRRPVIAMAALALVSLTGLWLLASFGARFDDRTMYEIAREALLALIAIAVIRSVLHFVLGIALARLSIPAMASDVLLGLALIVYALVRLTVVGVNLAGVVTTSAVITGAIAFSAQEVLGALWAGLALQLDRTLRMGDWLSFEGKTGEIVAIRWRTTTIRTKLNESIVIPNASLIKDKVHVLARGTQQKAGRELRFSVSYESPPAEVVAVANEALRRAEVPNLAREPAPHCYCLGFEDSGIGYAVYYAVEDYRGYRNTHSELLSHLYAALQRAGMSIPFPQRDVHLYQEAGPEETRRRQSAQRLRVLSSIGLFASLTPQELQSLAESVQRCLFVEGDVLFRQGEAADSMFVLTRGRLAVHDEREPAQRKRLATIDPPAYVGEMGLLTGQARMATVIAESPVECLRLDKLEFDSILRGRPEIVEALSSVLATRLAENDALLQSLGERQRGSGHRNRALDLVQRMRRFFSLAAPPSS